MSWADAMKEMADASSRNGAYTDANAMRSAASTSWDPYEVWLRRIKQPRDLAARRPSADTEDRLSGLRG